MTMLPPTTTPRLERHEAAFIGRLTAALAARGFEVLDTDQAWLRRDNTDQPLAGRYVTVSANLMVPDGPVAAAGRRRGIEARVDVVVVADAYANCLTVTADVYAALNGAEVVVDTDGAGGELSTLPLELESSDEPERVGGSWESSTTWTYLA